MQGSRHEMSINEEIELDALDNVQNVVPAEPLDDDDKLLAGDVPGPLVPDEQLVVPPGSVVAGLNRYRRDFRANNPSVVIELRYVYPCFNLLLGL